MSTVQLHLILNYLPLIGVPIGAVVLLAGAGLRHRSAMTASLVIFAAAGLLAVPVYISGLLAQEAMSEAARASAASLEIHAAAAPIATIITVTLGLGASAALMILGRRATLPMWLVAALIAFAAVSTAMLIRTASLGVSIHAVDTTILHNASEVLPGN